MKLHLVLLLTGLSMTLWGCRKNCGPSNEPRLELSIVTTSAVRLTEIYALQTVTTAPALTLPASTSAPNRAYWTLNLPLNLTADKTQYVLVSTARRDTVMVNYRRTFTYEDAECGYVVNILPRLTAAGQQVADSLTVQTTTGTVNNLYFLPTTSRTFFTRSSDTGIYLSLLWL